MSSPEIFVEDFSAGVDFLGTQPFVDRDRIGLLGICGSGGFGLSAAQADPRIKAVATVSMYDISRMFQEGMHGSLTDDARLQQLEVTAQQRWDDLEAYAPVLTPRGAAIGFDENTDPIAREFGEFGEFYSTPRGYHPNALSQFTVTSTMSFMTFPLLTQIEWIPPRPILFVAGENAFSRYFSQDPFQAAAEPKELYIVPGAGHVDLYDKTDLIPFGKLETFFAKNMA